MEKELGLILMGLGIIYVVGKPTLDFSFGRDSFWSRYLNRPFIKLITNNYVDTEEQYQRALEQNRKSIIEDSKLVRIIRKLP